MWSVLTPVERRGAFLLLGLMVVGMVFETLGVGLVVPVIALLVQSDYMDRLPVLRPLLVWMGEPSHKTVVIGAMLALVAVYFFKVLFLAFLVWRQTRFAFNVQARLSQRLFAAYLAQPYTFHLQRNSAQLIRNVTGEVSLLRSNVLIPSMLLLTDGFVLCGLCALLLGVEPLGALIVVSVLGLVGWAFHRITRGHVARWGLLRQRHEGLSIQSLQEGLGGAKDVKLLGREAEFLRQYDSHNVQTAHVGQLQFTLQQLPRLWLELLAVGGLAALVLTVLAQGRAPQAALPTLALFAAVAFRVMPSVGRVLGAVHSLRYARPVIDTLYAELQLGVPVVEQRLTTVTPFRHTLELDRVSFTYPGAHAPSLTDLSLTVRRGESVGFIGASGAGKSTLVDILLGLLAPEEGEVRVDSKNIQMNLRNWQDQIGYVPQSIFLTDDTLRRNVAFGLADEQIDNAAVWRAIRAAQLDELLHTLPQGLDTVVGERGIRLSGGQRQRIGIARALYHDPGVLVLDEATSSLDTTTERDVMQAVNALRGDKTVLIVAHRLTTVEQCGRLYRLEQGKVVEEGTPDAMLPVKMAGKSN